jgi:F0F1-type ATP synthase membrane subunit c/vacuolar-type H+-ATPase subunit K
VLVLNARRDVVEPVPPEANARVILLLAVPLSAAAFALVGAVVADGADDAARTPLLVLGAAAFVQAAAQGLIARAHLRSVLEDVSSLGPALVVVVMPEILTVGAFVWLFITVGPAAGGA